MIFIETEPFTKRLEGRLTSEEYRRVQNTLTDRPDFGKVIRGSGGIRKMRVKAHDRGASGGVRVIYYYIQRNDRIYLLDLYAKNEKSDLTKAEIEELAQIVRVIKDFEYVKRSR